MAKAKSIKKNPVKGKGWTGWRKGKTETSGRAGTSRKKVPMPRLPRNIGPPGNDPIGGIGG